MNVLKNVPNVMIAWVLQRFNINKFLKTARKPFKNLRDLKILVFCSAIIYTNVNWSVEDERLLGRKIICAIVHLTQEEFWAYIIATLDVLNRDSCK